MRNLVGKKVGRLTVLSKEKEKINHRCVWRCACSCGKTVAILQQSLVKYSPTLSCGCLKAEALTKDLIGQHFGFWRVEQLSTKKKKPNGGAYWFCVCVCGEKKEVSAESLLSGRSTSCSCSKERPICPQGHIISEWGRDDSGMCRACIKNRNFIRNYGITLLEYIEIWKHQKGLCAICGEKVSIALGRPGYGDGCRAELDHEHNEALEKKKQVRGILCGGRWSGCNRKLGRIDDVKWLRAATNYVENPPARTFLEGRLHTNHN
jgi:hypothetical protein